MEVCQKSEPCVEIAERDGAMCMTWNIYRYVVCSPDELGEAIKKVMELYAGCIKIEDHGQQHVVWTQRYVRETDIQKYEVKDDA